VTAAKEIIKYEVSALFERIRVEGVNFWRVVELGVKTYEELSVKFLNFSAAGRYHPPNPTRTASSAHTFRGDATTTLNLTAPFQLPPPPAHSTTRW
jgi:hypothetical protein